MKLGVVVHPVTRPRLGVFPTSETWWIPTLINKVLLDSFSQLCSILLCDHALSIYLTGRRRIAADFPVLTPVCV
jgi:hypothetical protein